MGKLRKEDIILRKKIKLRLKQLRGKESKSGLAKEIDIDRQNFQPWEEVGSERGMTIYSISRVCKSMGITLKEFFDDEIFREDL